MRYAVAEAKKSFSRLLREAQTQPVVITRHGKPEAVMMSYTEYNRLRRLQAYEQLLALNERLRGQGPLVDDLLQASRADLDQR